MKSHATDLERLNAAFGELQDLGWLAYQALDMCPDCCNAFIRDELALSLGHEPTDEEYWTANVAFWHSDGLRVFTPNYSWDEDPTETIQHELFIHWSGDAEEIRRVLEKHELATAWPGGIEDSIAILPSIVPPNLAEVGRP